MKTKLRLLTTITAALVAAPVFAEDERKPVAPAPLRSADEFRTPPLSRPSTRPTAFLGVATSPVEPVLAAQLGLPEGFGLVVDEVMPESPAGKAGVQRFDVLRLFNDQQLTDPGQLAALVRAAGKDAEVSLTLLRKGQEQKFSMKIAERPMPVRAPLGDLERPIKRLEETFESGARKLQEKTREFQDRMKEYEERLKKWQANPGGDMPKPPMLNLPVEPANILREVRPGGAAQVRVLEPNGSVTYNTANAKVLMKDDSGEIEVSSSDGRRKLVAKNAQGEVIFDGPIDTPEQVKALPEELRKKVESIEVRTKVAPGVPPPPVPPAPGRELQ